MSGHGGVGRASLAGLDRASILGNNLEFAAETARASTAYVAGRDLAAGDFRNFGFASAAPSTEIYVGLGSAWETQSMFAKLMRRMAQPYRFADGVASDNAHNFNPRTPAGYTYLGQFAAHDIIRNSALLSDLGAKETRRRNLREQSLMLDALYGGGPALDERVYERSKPGEGFRTMLRTGGIDTVGMKEMVQPGDCPFNHRDIPRFAQADLSDNVQSGRPDILIPDARNDDNAMVAQMTALFHHVHNAVVTALRGPGIVLADLPGEDALPKGLRLFLNARRVTTALYRRILRDDFLKHLMSDAMWETYGANGFKPLVDTAADGLPLEFTHAAYRIGHSMVRMSYLFNEAHPMGEGIRDALKLRSSVRPQKLPPTTDWIADWSRFFDIGDTPPQPSRRIGPSYNEVLLSERLFGNKMVQQPTGVSAGGEIPNGDFAGLLFSDLIRGAVGNLLTLDGLLAKLPRDIVEASPLLADKAHRTKVLSDWLKAVPSITFTDAELEHLSANPPLIFWLLFEAATETNGCALGTMASVIIGDVFLARLAPRPQDAEADRAAAEMMELLFGAEVPANMPQLISFTAHTLGLTQAIPVFLKSATS